MVGREGTVQRLTFRKQERMVSRLLIESLFGGGNSHSVAAYPLRAVYKVCPRQQDDAPVQLLISVPKKRFHHAVDRNRVKRQVREAYRKHKQRLYESLTDEQRLLLAFVWQSDSLQPTAEVERRVKGLLQRVAEKL